MHKHTSIVEVNGQKYDMATGQIIGAVKKTASRLKRPSPFISLDGIVRLPIMAKVRPASRNQRPKRVVHNVRRKAQHSTTLMRRIVSRSKEKAKKPTALMKKRLIGHSPVREAHAKQTFKHHKVKRFGILSSAHKSRVKEGSDTMALSRPMPSVAVASSHQKLERLLDLALARADAHKQSRRKKHSGAAKLLGILPRWLNVFLIFVIVISLIGFIAWNEIPALSMRLAASKAHVDSSIPNLPGYIVASPAKEKDGVVTIQLKAEADPSNTVTVTKKAVGATDPAVLSEKSCPNDNQIQTFSQNGATSFICGQTNKAVGVSNGVMTEIKPNGEQSITGSASSLFTGQ